MVGFLGGCQVFVVVTCQGFNTGFYVLCLGGDTFWDVTLFKFNIIMCETDNIQISHPSRGGGGV